MALGKAFIEVHADTKPFARELGRELDKILRDVEKNVVAKQGEKSGKTFGDNLAKGVDSRKGKVRKSFGDLFDSGDNQSVFSRFASGLIDTIDDGISGLPAELKVVLGATLAAVAPVAGGIIAAAISSALTIGLAAAALGLSGLIAFQFTEVRDRAQEVFSDLRNIFLADAGEFILSPFLGALDLVEARVLALRPLFTSVFSSFGRLIIPVTDALLSFVEGFVPFLGSIFAGIEPLIPTLAAGLREIGVALGAVLATLANDPGANAALNDILLLIRDLIVFIGALTLAFLKLYNVIRSVADILDVFSILQFGLDGVEEASVRAAAASDQFGRAVVGTIAATKAEEDTLEALNKQIQQYVRDNLAARRATIGFEQALDDMSTELKNGKLTLDANTQAGRDNQSAILNAAEALIRQRDATIAATGETDKANATFATNRERLRAAAVAAGLSADKFDALTAEILDVPPSVNIQVPNNQVNSAIGRWQAFGNLIGNILQQAATAAAKAAGLPTSPNQMIPHHGDGTITSTPHLAVVGDSPEAIIPLNDPGRASQLLNQSGLSSMLTPSVNVYIGNSQIDAYIATGVRREMALTARTASYGTR